MSDAKLKTSFVDYNKLSLHWQCSDLFPPPFQFFGLSFDLNMDVRLCRSCFAQRLGHLIRLCCTVFQAQREDPLPVGVSNEREAELLKSVLQPFVLCRAPGAGAFHSALQFQVSMALPSVV